MTPDQLDDAAHSNDEPMGRALYAVLAWGEAREELGRARVQAEREPSEDLHQAEERAEVYAGSTLARLNEALAEAGVRPLPNPTEEKKAAEA